MRLFLLSLLSLYSPLSVFAADSQACPHPIPYVPVPMNLNGTTIVGPTPDPLHNDGMIGTLPGGAGWCTVPNPDTCPNPAGFKQGAYYPDNNPPFCLVIPGVRNRMVEIMVESIAPGNKICVTDTDANSVSNIGVPLVNQCDFGATRACFVGPNGDDARVNLTISISCSDNVGCATSDVEFWYRVRVSNMDFVNAGTAGSAANSAVTSPEMWCSMIATSAKFPSEYASAAGTYSIAGAGDVPTPGPTGTGKPNNQGQTITTNIMALFVTVMAAIMLRQ